MKSVKIVSIGLVVVVVVGIALLEGLTQFVPAGMSGVRIQQYSLFGKQGVIQKDFGPGWHRDFGPIDQWVMYNATVHTLEMAKAQGQGSMPGRDDVMVQSIDGNPISLDVTVKYRITPEKAHLLYQNTGSGAKYMNIVRIEAESACMSMFGQMKTEEFAKLIEDTQMKHADIVFII